MVVLCKTTCGRHPVLSGWQMLPWILSIQNFRFITLWSSVILKLLASKTSLDEEVRDDTVSYENIQSFVNRTKDLYQIIMNLMDADTLMSRIMTRMDFSLLPYYFDLVSGGVILSVENSVTKGNYQFSMPNLRNLQLKFANDIMLDEMQHVFFMSKSDIVNHILPQLREIISLHADTEQNIIVEKISHELGVSASEMKKYLK